jgi:hypothetical protein
VFVVKAIGKSVQVNMSYAPLLFNFALEYAIMKVRENQVGLKLNGTHEMLVCADYVTLLGGNIDTIGKNTEAVIDASEEVGLEVNTEKTYE